MTRFDRPLKQLKLRLIGLRLLHLSVLVLASVAVAELLFSMPFSLSLYGAIGIYGIGFLQLFASDAYRQLNVQSFLMHLNRSDERFEESAQLLIAENDTLSAIQRLQKEKVSALYAKVITDKKIWLPASSTFKSMLAIAVFTGFLIFVSPMDIRAWFTNQLELQPVSDEEQHAENIIVSADVTITPPSYTGLEVISVSSLDIETLAGSEIVWSVRFKNMSGVYSLKLADGAIVPLQQQDDGSYLGRLNVEQTNLYRVIHSIGGTEQSLPGVYALTIHRDKAPKVRIIEPKTTVVEISKTGSTVFAAQALVSDDFAISKVNILASVAKGSGEAVKFRDETFEFDRSEESPQGQLYTREWDLQALGMEPGDEVYFRVNAWDNKTPVPSKSESGTVIVRWLDEEVAPIAAEGILLDFVPEYFKSQRQIIIETEQLLADKADLKNEVFSEISYGLGHAQSDLKAKYGQYLGDEVGEGPGDQLADIGAELDEHHEADEHGDDDDQDEHQGGKPEAGHLHENTPVVNDRSGASAMIARFGHNHEEADIGPVTKRNPKALMKRAVSIMWQAELHLMLAEPEKALPFEYEALKYLKLAKQADRIYVKRLGFEPPPVSEERRLSGELNEIASYETVAEKHADSEDEQLLFRRLFKELSRYSGSNQTLTADMRMLLSEASKRFVELSQSRPALIKHAATLEKILLADRMVISNCNDCVPALTSTLWKMIHAPLSAPRSRGGHYLGSDLLARSFRERIQVFEKEPPK